MSRTNGILKGKFCVMSSRMPQTQCLINALLSRTSINKYSKIYNFCVVHCGFCKIFNEVSLDIWWKTEKFLNLMIVIICSYIWVTDCTEEALMTRLLPSGSISLSALSPMLLPLTRQVFNIWLTLEEREDMAVNVLNDTRLGKGVKRKDVESRLKIFSIGWHHGPEKTRRNWRARNMKFYISV